MYIQVNLEIHYYGFFMSYIINFTSARAIEIEFITVSLQSHSCSPAPRRYIRPFRIHKIFNLKFKTIKKKYT